MILVAVEIAGAGRLRGASLRARKACARRDAPLRRRTDFAEPKSVGPTLNCWCSLLPSRVALESGEVRGGVFAWTGASLACAFARSPCASLARSLALRFARLRVRSRVCRLDSALCSLRSARCASLRWQRFGRCAAGGGGGLELVAVDEAAAVGASQEHGAD